MRGVGDRGPDCPPFDPETRPRALAADLRASPIRLVYDATDGGRGIRVDHIFWAVVSIVILGVLMSLLLRMLFGDFLAGPSSGRRRPRLKG